MSPDDIKFYHSGGSGNCDPDKDLGGEISSCELQGGLDKLFDTLDAKKSRIGVIDYRCFYVKNTNPSETLRKTKVYIDSEGVSGSFIDLGVDVDDEKQTINVNGPHPPDEGQKMTLELPNYGQFTVYYHVNITEWQGRFQTEMRGLEGMNDVRVSVTGEIGFPTDVTFTIYFGPNGAAQSRDLDEISVVSHDLRDCTVMPATLNDGAPISVTACTIGTKLQAPACVEFEYPLRGNPVELGDLRPGEKFPIWARRTTPGLEHDSPMRVMTVKLTKDNFRINVDGTFP